MPGDSQDYAPAIPASGITPIWSIGVTSMNGTQRQAGPFDVSTYTSVMLLARSLTNPVQVRIVYNPTTVLISPTAYYEWNLPDAKSVAWGTKVVLPYLFIQYVGLTGSSFNYIYVIGSSAESQQAGKQLGGVYGLLPGQTIQPGAYYEWTMRPWLGPVQFQVWNNNLCSMKMRLEAFQWPAASVGVLYEQATASYSYQWNFNLDTYYYILRVTNTGAQAADFYVNMAASD